MSYTYRTNLQARCEMMPHPTWWWLGKAGEGRELTAALPPAALRFTKTRSFHSKVMKHYGRPRPVSKVGTPPTAGVTLVHGPQAAAQLCGSLCADPRRIPCSSASGQSHTEQTSNLMNRLNSARSSLSHSFHTMSAPATISALSPREDAVQEVSHSMNVHFHFRAQ